MAADERPKWLPKGWTAVSKTTRSGATLWFFYDPDTGSRFCSKKEVLKHLKAGKLGNHTMRQTRSTTRRSMEKNSVPTNSDANNKMDSTKNDYIMDDPHELPQGWIKEIRSRKTGLRSDPFYIDPVSGYEFRSLKDVYRYIETGDVDKCANRPRKRSIGESNALEVESQISATKTVESGGSEVVKCLFSGVTDNLDVKMEKQINACPGESQLRPDNASSVEEADFSSMMSIVTKKDKPNEKEIKAVTELNSTCQEFKVSGDILELGKEHTIEEAAIENPSTNFSYCLSESQIGTIHEPSLARQLNFSDECLSNAPYEIQHGSDLQASSGKLSEGTNLTLKEEEMELKKPKRTREQGSRKSRTFRAVTMPLRASPRLAALRAETEAKSALDEESSRPESKHLHQLEVNLSTQDNSTDSKQELNQQGMLSVDLEVSRRLETKLFPGEVGPAKNPVVLEGTSKDEPVSELTSIFGDSWLDPCIQFAFKTLIGDIPELDNTVVVQDCPQQQQTSSARSQCPSNSDSLALHNIGRLNQNDHLAQMEPQNSNMLSFGGNKRTCFVENGLQPTKNLKEVRQWRS